MTILVFGERATRTHENRSLQAFLAQLESRWATSDDWIYVIANAMWGGAEIDLVCILPTMVLVADFKGHSGRITGTENGPWQADGLIVKGGSKSNPFQQLRDNKFSVLNWLSGKSLLPNRNLGHIAAAVLFNGPLEDELDLSPKVRSWFYPTDLNKCADLLDALASPDLVVSRDEAEEIIQRLGVRPIDWVATTARVHDLPVAPERERALASLTEHQDEVREALMSFIESSESVSFSVLGMTSTGKSHLLAAIHGACQSNNHRVLVLAPNQRLAGSAGRKLGLEVESIYGHLYGASVQQTANEADAEAKANVIPLKESNDPEDCVYLVDDAHLLGNAKFTTPDGKQYGSGRLLTDFFEFAGLGRSRRKVVFFGDPYQLQRAVDESVLAGSFQQSLGISHQSVELTQLIEASGTSVKLANAALLVSAIRA